MIPDLPGLSKLRIMEIVEVECNGVKGSKFRFKFPMNESLRKRLRGQIQSKDIISECILIH